MGNPFQDGRRKVVPATLIYARSRGFVLMLDRNAGGDMHEGKWNGLGGKFELGESPLEAARREFLEESGFELEAERFRVLGVLQFPNFSPERSEDWIVYVFEADFAEREVAPGLLRKTREGDLHWIAESGLLSLPLWEGDREFLPLVLKRRPFVGTFWYENKSLLRSWLTTLA